MSVHPKRRLIQNTRALTFLFNIPSERVGAKYAMTRNDVQNISNGQPHRFRVLRRLIVIPKTDS